MTTANDMDTSADHDLTQLIAAWRRGETPARDALMDHVYANVRAIAAQSLRAMPGATLSATDLAHEALLRVLSNNADWESRRHLFHVVAQATRQVLVDTARRRVAIKRGEGAEHLPLTEAARHAASEQDQRLLHLDDALADLAATDPRRARIVELIYFGGLSRQEVASSLELSESSVDRDLRLARAWLKSQVEP